MKAIKLLMGASLAVLGTTSGAFAQDAGIPERDIPPDVIDRYIPRDGLVDLARRTQENREDVREGRELYLSTLSRSGIQISGVKAIPVLPVRFKNTAADPYDVANLQRELFDGPWPTGTMADYFREVSYGTFSVTGRVYPWRSLANDDTFYEGAAFQGEPCRGRCRNANVGDFVAAALKAHDADVDFRLYDNDGADGVANSGDDDGKVDFVALVQPESGGECENSTNMWSHRYSLVYRTGNAFETNDIGARGSPILVDDYVLAPAFACDGTTMIQIGVFAHEFGHAFGLPDLYDTDKANGDSSGIGTWGLMGTGSWGADAGSPETPTHMSAWEKEYLGWVRPTIVGGDVEEGALHPVEKHPDVYRIPINDDEYYLVEYRKAIGFDKKLWGSGLLVWRINQAVINQRRSENRVNADATRKGVALVEADGSRQLESPDHPGDFGDMFRGSGNRVQFDGSTRPRSVRGALCDIGEAADANLLSIIVSRARCQQQ